MTVLPDLLDAWQQAIDGHHPEQVADLFTEDAVFQGLHPYSIGRAGVQDYLAGQPAGMTVAYRILQTRELADDVVLGWVEAGFTFVDRPPVAVDLTVVARRADDAWRIAHYHVSPRIPAKESTPAGFVSYGSVGGARAAEHLRLIAGELNSSSRSGAWPLP